MSSRLVYREMRFFVVTWLWLWLSFFFSIDVWMFLLPVFFLLFFLITNISILGYVCGVGAVAPVTDSFDKLYLLICKRLVGYSMLLVLVWFYGLPVQLQRSFWLETSCLLVYFLSKWGDKSIYLYLLTPLYNTSSLNISYNKFKFPNETLNYDMCQE